MNPKRRSVLFLGKKNDEHVTKALQFCQQKFSDVMVHLGDWGDPLPKEIEAWEGDYIFSYLSRWIVPEGLLKKARGTAINFHPAPPNYPGYGCSNFALYEGAKEYGVTCHHMALHVDTGAIIAVKRFPIIETDDVATLQARTYDQQLQLFYEVVNLILEESELPAPEEQWTRRPFTRKELNALARITPNMTREEIARRIKATTFGNWKPIIEIQGFVFELKTK